MNSEENNKPKKKKNPLIGNIIITLGLMLIIIGIYSYLSIPEKKAEPKPLAEITPVVAQEAAPAVPAIEPQPATPAVTKTSEPVTDTLAAKVETQVEAKQTLPSLDKSDSIALTSAQQLSSLTEYNTLLIKKEMIRNFVVFVDNFARGELISNFSPLSRPSEPFTVINHEQKLFLNSESYQRYNIYADIINSIDVKLAVSQFHTLKPLFDEAYQEMGYPDAEFENSLNEAIELVLDTPVIHKQIELVAPSAMYKFADPQLEALPDAQKLLLRMGPDNLLKLKAKLQQLENGLQTF